LSPSGPSIRCATEPILVFAKGRRGRRRLSGAGRGACIRGDMTQEEWMAWTVDAWFVRGDSDPAHPAVFPLAIPRRLIKLYTYPGEVVLDPHNGRGTTTTAAKQLGRHWIGIDANPDYCRQARQWLERTDVEMLHPA
jgi:modification methylase